ncbi:MAG: hypothetical protein ACREMJ_06800 [Gemmatimonadales bacterium]
MEILIPITFFLSMAAIFIFRGPLGKAIGERLSGRAGPDPELRAEVEELRRHVAELEERLDFAERLLAKQRQQVLPKPGV